MVLGRVKETPKSYYAAAPAPAPAGPNISSVQHNLEVRVGTLTEKIRKCDEELIRQKAEMGKHRKDSPMYNAAKQRAARTLKQKKMLENQRDVTFKQQMNIDAVSMAVEQANEAQDTIRTLEQTEKQLAKDLKRIDLDKAENVQDNLEDILNETNYISETLGRDYTVDNINEADLEAELDHIEEDLYVNASSSVPTTAVPQFKPAVPTAHVQEPSIAPHVPANKSTAK